jgi:threonine dehydratase
VAPTTPHPIASPDPPTADAHDDGLVGIADIRAAAANLAGITVRTPLVPFGRPIDGHPQGHTRIWLKPESLQPIGAFKLRGAYHALASLPAEDRARGVVAHSSGNHAQGVARAARILGIRAVIVMPSDAPAVKLAGVRADGAEVVRVGSSSDERVQVSESLAGERGLVLIPAYDDPHIIAGQGTCGLEIVEQLHDLGYGDVAFTVLVPIGGGGFASGVASAVKALRPDSRVLGVEPEMAADAEESLRVGRIVRWDAERVGRTSADGMRTSSLGRLTFRHLAARLDGVLTVSEPAIRRAMVRAGREARLVLEPSGATTLAASLFELEQLPEDGPVVVILSGGNVDGDRYAELLAEGIAAGG